jgi:hypothetical protein
MIARIAGAIAAIAIMFSLEYWLRVEWYVAVPLGIFGYGCVRYIGYYVSERRSINYMVQAVEHAKDQDD